MKDKIEEIEELIQQNNLKAAVAEMLGLIKSLKKGKKKK